MCGQENKKMTLLDTIEKLKEECIELHLQATTSNSVKETEKIVLEHIKNCAKTDLQFNDFPKGLEWFNVSEGLSAEHLTGKIVVLDFFTYCCINCMHILPDLAALETKYAINDGLIVIGVHSAKFSNEKESSKILSAVQRYNITHPVINDDKLRVWRNLGINCWPTLVILGPKGQPLFVLMGEGHRNKLFMYIKIALSYFKSLDQISNHGIPLKPDHHLLPKSENALRFPSKVRTFMTSHGEKIVISDSGNNKILVAKLNGVIEHVIGSGSAGFKDGKFDDARFNAPQGICILNDNNIYVADNENHAIRLIDLKEKIVTTVAGTGAQGNDYRGGKCGKQQALSSPWDVAIYHHSQDKETVPVLLIAAAGTHQIWALFIKDTIWWKKTLYKSGTCAAIIGDGREANKNNSYPHAASLAQPSGLAVAQKLQVVYFADSESSSIRSVHLQDGRVSAVVGGDKNPADLHNFGDVDGVKHSVKLQHPLGVAWDPFEGVVYIADTYNHKIKMIDPTGKCKTLYGDGKPTKHHMFDEPSGLAVLTTTNELLIADTNNHCIKIIGKNDQTIRTMALEFLERIQQTADKTFNFETDLNDGDSKMTILLSPILDSGLTLSPNAPQSWILNSLPANWSAPESSGVISSPTVLTAPEGNAESKISIRLKLVLCKADQCIPRTIDTIFTVKRKSDAPGFVELSRELKSD